MVDGLILEVGLSDCLGRSVEDRFGGAESEVLEGFDHPSVDFVAELVEVDVFLAFLDVAVYVDGVAGDHGGEAYVEAFLADCQRHLLGMEEHLGLLLLLVDADGADLGGRERTLDEERRIGRIVEHVDVLVAELANDAVDSASLYADACSYGVDAVVVALYGDFRALTGDACHGLDRDESIVDFGHFLLEQAAQEPVVGAADDHLGVVVGVVDALNDGPHDVALVEEVARYLLLLRHYELVLLLVDEQHLLLPDLMYLSGDDFALELAEFGVDCVFLQVEYLRLQGLTEVEDGAASELLEIQALGDVFAYFSLGVYLAGLGESDLFLRVVDVIVGHHHEVLVNLAVALVGVHDDVEVLV